MARPILHVLRLGGRAPGGARTNFIQHQPAAVGPTHIFRQLEIEEALYRTDTRNWCIINEGCPDPSPCVILGISGKPPKMCNLDLVRQRNVPMYRRFTGGGTVVVDENTNFFSLVCNGADIGRGSHDGPRELMSWTAELYSQAFARLGADVSFNLRENDYVFGDHKFAGNAQALSKDRFVHHTSLLWDYNSENMSLLTNPEKQPDYRAGRDHADFLLALKNVLQSRSSLSNELVAVLADNFFDTCEISLKDLLKECLLQQNYRRSNTLLSVDG